MESDERVQEVMLKCSIDGDGFVDFSKFADSLATSTSSSAEGAFFRLPWGSRMSGGVSQGEAAAAPAPAPEQSEFVRAPEPEPTPEPVRLAGLDEKERGDERERERERDERKEWREEEGRKGVRRKEWREGGRRKGGREEGEGFRQTARSYLHSELTQLHSSQLHPTPRHAQEETKEVAFNESGHSHSHREKVHAERVKAASSALGAIYRDFDNGMLNSSQFVSKLESLGFHDLTAVKQILRRIGQGSLRCKSVGVVWERAQTNQTRQLTHLHRP